MEKTKVGINGFGRIGRLALRRLVQLGFPVDVLLINDPFLKVIFFIFLQILRSHLVKG